ncbi:MAG TPA: GntR family transcriptional regulator [Thermomicrobiales bacterium]|jgi:DNA-binding GntR family transcriptional regulator
MPLETLAPPIGFADASAADVAYQRLKRLIVTVEIPPGTALSEPALVARLGIGRTPVREALRRLAGERLVVIFPRRGLVVAQLGLQEVQQLFEARLAVEGETARFAARRADEPAVASLTALNRAVHAAEDDGSFAAFLDVDQRLHREIARIARNTFLAESADRILTLTAWLWHAHMTRYGIEPSDYASHDRIVAAIADRDAGAARQAMVDHIERSRELLRVTL